MCFLGLWVYFATILNWDAAEVDDPKTVEAYFRATGKAITDSGRFRLLRTSTPPGFTTPHPHQSNSDTLDLCFRDFECI